jgi:hypothetical protein
MLGNNDEVREHVALLLTRESDGRRRCTPVREILKGRGGPANRMRSKQKQDKLEMARLSWSAGDA